MAKVILMQNPFGVKFPYQEGNLLKIMESEEEPPKQYIWKTPGDYLFVYCNDDWMFVYNYIENNCSCTVKPNNPTYSQSTLAKFKQDIIKLLESRQYNVPVNLESRLRELENRLDDNTVYDDAELRELIRQIAAEHEEFVTAQDI